MAQLDSQVGNQSTDDLKETVWENGIIDPKYDKDSYRKDRYGCYMRREEYGNRGSEFGWEIDHVNLQPIFWMNNTKE